MEEVENQKAQLLLAVKEGNADRQVLLFRQLQQSLITTRDLGNRKLEISSRLLEIVEDYKQQLAQKQKAVDSSSTDEFYQAPRLSSGVKEVSAVESKSKRSSGTKRARPHQSVEPVEEEINGHVRDSVSQLSSISNSNNGRSAKKKIKTIKKKTNAVNVKAADESPPSFPAVPMPDLTSQPLDPNEPTYCLCQQVSFGEMIGCDNEECPIEWFHFQCVNLTSKPKGKWYCPQCSQGRRNSKPLK